MIIPGIKHENKQLRLFDQNYSGHAYARNILGDFVERLTASVFRGKRYKTDSRCEYCPDVIANGIYLECKSAGKSRQTFIYAGRLIKDRIFSREHRLAYVIWHHTASVKSVDTAEDLRALFLQKMKALYLIPFEGIDMICSGRKEEPLNSKYGGTDRSVYGSGFRIPVRELEPYKIEWRFI